MPEAGVVQSSAGRIPRGVDTIVQLGVDTQHRSRGRTREVGIVAERSVERNGGRQAWLSGGEQLPGHPAAEAEADGRELDSGLSAFELVESRSHVGDQPVSRSALPSAAVASASPGRPAVPTGGIVESPDAATSSDTADNSAVAAAPVTLRGGSTALEGDLLDEVGTKGHAPSVNRAPVDRTTRRRGGCHSNRPVGVRVEPVNG